MAPEGPQLISIAAMVRADRKVLFVRHARGPFAGRWSLPLRGVADVETAEEAIERLLGDLLHVKPGPYEFLDTLYVTGAGGERFIGNAFTCIDWEGDPRFPAEVFDDALWAPPSDAASLDLLPEMRDWLIEAFGASEGAPQAVEFDPATLLATLADARGEFLAALDAIPAGQRDVALDEAGWSALDVLAHAGDVEAYYRSEVVRCQEAPGRTWRMFNSDQWFDSHRLRPREDEPALRARLEAVRAETRTWLTYQPPENLVAYFNHPERGVVQAGNRIEKIAAHDREHAGQLRRMAQAAALQAAADDLTETEDQP